MKNAFGVVTQCVAVAALFAAVTFGQVITSTLSGTVRDKTGAVLPVAQVTATNADTGISRSVTSDSAGRYLIPQLEPGNYTVTAAMTGFSSQRQSGVVLTVGRTTVLDFTLEVGAIEQTVEVTASAPVVETTTASIEALVGRQQVENLPLNGRSFTQLATLQVGVATLTNATQDSVFGGKGIKMSVAGSRQDANSFLLDGGDVNDQYNKTPGSVAGVMLGVDTVREFQVLTSNFSAEYGRVSGGIINAITRSGSNTLHGSVFEYLRNSALDARNFFDRDPQNPTVRSDPPPFKRNQFGGTLDGPIKRDKAFFLVSYEGLRQRLSETFFYQVPDDNVRRGILPNGTQVQVHPTIAPYLALWPRANGRVFGGGSAEFISTQNQPTREDWFTARVDYNFSASDSFFVRYTRDDAEQTLQRTGRLTFFPELQENQQHFATIENTHIFSPTTLNTMRFALNRQTGGAASEDLLPVPKSLYFQPNSVHFGSIGVSGWSSFGPETILPITNAMTSYQFMDNLTLVRGAHNLKTGVLIQRFQWNNDDPFNVDGVWTFPDIERFLDGGSSGMSLSVMLPGSDTYKGQRLTLFGVYIQDDWRWRPNFTWNLGFRYEITDTLEEVNGKASHFIDARRDPEVTIGPLFKNPSLFNLAPRIGFAWSPGSSGKWAISGAGGIYYDQILNNYVDTFRFAAPFYKFGNPSNFRALGVFPDSVAAAGAVPKTTRMFDYFNMKSPMVLRYNFGIQRALTSTLGVRVSYVGSRGNHLIRTSWVNHPDHVIVDGRVTEIRNSPRANPNWQSIPTRATDSQAFYNSLQLQVSKQMSQGLMFQANYTWSKSIDDNSSMHGNDFSGAACGSQDPKYAPIRLADRGLSCHDRRHVFQFNYSYAAPLGAGHTYLKEGIGKWILGDWNIQGIVSLQSGFPFTISGGGRRQSGYLIWPSGGIDLLEGMDPSPVLGGPDKYYEPSGFLRGLVPAGVMDNMPRDAAVGPGLANVDFSLVKNFPVTERTNLEFRGEFFNLFNRANFGPPDATAILNGAINPTAGRITKTTRTSRQVQFGLRLRF